MMGSGADTAHETVEHLNTHGEKVGLLKVRFTGRFRSKLLRIPPPSVRKIAVLDRTKEAGSSHEPLCLDVLDALQEGLKLGYGH